MPILTITNRTSSSIGIQDPSGLAFTAFTLLGNTTVAKTLTVEQLNALVPTLASLTAAQYLTWSVSDDPTSMVDVPVVNPLSHHDTTAVEFIQDRRIKILEDAMSGDLLLALDGGPANETVLAADLNAAAAGTFKRQIPVVLRSAAGSVHTWARFTPTIVVAEAVADADVAAPTVTGTPKFVDGFLNIEVTFDTDAGATKVYAAADTVTVTVKASSSSSLLGFSVTNLVKTFTVA